MINLNPFANSIDNLTRQTEDILGVFNKTVTSLQEVNTKAQEELVKKEEEIKKLEAERLALNTLKSSNEKVINKITMFLTAE